MSVEILFYITTFLASILGLILAFVALSYRSLIKRYYEIQKQKEILEKSAQNEANKILNNAKKQAFLIINDSKVITEEIKATLNSKLDESATSQVREFDKYLSESREKMNKMFTSISQEISKQSLGEIENFKNELKQQTLKSQELLKTAIDESNQKLMKDMEVIKQKKIEQLNVQLLDIIKKVSKEVVSKAINIKDHEALIMEALEEAKAKKLLG